MMQFRSLHANNGFVACVESTGEKNHYVISIDGVGIEYVDGLTQAIRRANEIISIDPEQANQMKNYALTGQPITRAKAIEMIQVVANHYGINDAFDLFDDSMIDYKLGLLARTLEEQPLDRQGNRRCPLAVWFRIVEDELGLDSGDPQEIREFEIHMRG